MKIRVTVFPWFLPVLDLTPHMRVRLSWKKPLISSRTVTQPHTHHWQWGQLGWFRSAVWLLHCTHLVFVLYRDIKLCAFQWRTRTTGVHPDLAEVNWTHPRIVPGGKYGLMLIVPVGSNQGNTLLTNPFILKYKGIICDHEHYLSQTWNTSQRGEPNAMKNLGTSFVCTLLMGVNSSRPNNTHTYTHT